MSQLVGWALRAHQGVEEAVARMLKTLCGTGLTPTIGAMLCLSVLAPPNVSAAATKMDTPSVPEVAHVVIFGDWADGDRVGVVRYVHSSAGVEHPRSRAWVQWVEYEGEMGLSPKLVATREIDVLKGSYIVHVPTPNTRSGKLVLFASHSFERCTFRLSLATTEIGRLSIVAAAKGKSAADPICKIKSNRPVFE